jgi:hypothetical protein
MALTGKCKEEFEKWFKDKYLKLDSSFCNRFLNKRIFTPDATRYGIYIEFFDNVEYEGNSLFCKIFAMYYTFKTEDFTHNDIVRNSLEKANEIYNKVIMGTDE